MFQYVRLLHYRLHRDADLQLRITQIAMLLHCLIFELAFVNLTPLQQPALLTQAFMHFSIMMSAVCWAGSGSEILFT